MADNIANTKDKKKLWVTGSFNVDITEYQIEQPSLMGFKAEKEIGMNFKIAFPITDKYIFIRSSQSNHVIVAGEFG